MPARRALQNKSPESEVVAEVSSSSSLVLFFSLPLHPATNEKAAYLNTMADMASGFTYMQSDGSRRQPAACSHAACVLG